MAQSGHRLVSTRQQAVQGVALVSLLVLTGLALLGPSGLLAWGEQASLLEQRKAQLAVLEAERDELRGRVDALHPDRADPDMVGELLRKNMHVLHPDEIVLELEPEGK